jgi:hypothetical protein
MTLASRTGTETYLRDLALALLRAGHHPTVYCPDLGELAHELRMATIPVIDDLDRQANPPDVIHGNHHAETMTALLRFPGVPAVYFCHAWLAPVAAPPRFPRILRYVAVDQTCRDRLVDEHGIPADRVRVLLHTVDLERFRARGPLPERPGKALVFSNYANDQTHLGVVRQACERAGLTLDVCGAGVGASSDSPETRLREYDLVFAKGRCAQEALAVGCAVVLCDSLGAGPLVTADAYEQLRRLNFGARAMPHRSGADFLFGEISRYDARDAAQVTERLRATAGLEGGAREHIALYSEVLAESRSAGRANPHEEGRAAASYLRGITTFARDLRDYERRARLAEEERDRLRAERLQADRLQAQPRLPAVPPRGEWLRSGLCKQSELDSEAFRIWTARMRLCHKPHRKLWEYGFIAQALFERGLLRPGSCGLGFAVGQEPLVSLFAGFGPQRGLGDDQPARGRSGGLEREGSLRPRRVPPPRQLPRRRHECDSVGSARLRFHLVVVLLRAPWLDRARQAIHRPHDALPQARRRRGAHDRVQRFLEHLNH